MRKPSWMLVIMIMAAVVSSTGAAFAGTTNTPPYSDNFETYTNLTPLINGTNGWYGDSSAIVVQTNTVRLGTNAAMIPVDCTLSNRFQSIATTNVWIQMDLRPSLYDWTNNPVVDTNATAMFYINSNGHFVVHNGSTTNANNSTNWVVATNNVTIATNWTTWVRIDIYENFAQTNWNLYADGVLVTNNIGFVNTNATNFTGFNLYNGAATSYLDNVSVSAVNTNQPAFIVLPLTLSNVAFVGRTPPVQTVQVYNVWSDSSIGFEVTNNRPWILPTNGTVPATSTQDVVLTYANTAAWPAGAISNATVMVVATNATDRWGTQTVAVTMSIMDLQRSPTNIANTIAVGSTPTNRNLFVINEGAGSFSYTATSTNDWLSFSGLSETSGTVNAHSTNELTLTFANTAWWMSGTTSNTTIMIVSGDGGGATQTVNVALTLGMALQVEPAQLTNAVMQGDTASTNFLVWTTNQGVAVYTVTANQSWLMLDRAGGSLTGQTDGATNQIGVTYTNTSLPVGNKNGTITIKAPGCADIIMNVTLSVRAVPMLGVSPAAITKTVMAGQNLAAQTSRVWNGSADYGIGYQVTTNQGNASTTWLSVSVTNSHLAPLTTNTLTIQYAVSSLPSAGDVPSNYAGGITITATNANGSPASGSPVTIPVTVQVNPKPRMALSLTNLSQTVLQGQNASNQVFDVWNENGFYTLNYTISKGGAPWLVLAPTSGTSTGQHAQIVVQYSTANLPAGLTNAVITVVGRAWDGVHEDSAMGDATQQIAVALSVTPFATLTTDAQSAYAYTVRKGVTPPDTVVNVWNGGNLPGAMFFTVSPSVSWLSVTPASGTSTGAMVNVRVQADPTGMRPGVVYSGKVTIDATDEESGKTAYGSPSAFTISIVISNFTGFNFEGDLSEGRASDLVLYREANGAWEIRNLLSNYATTQFLGGVGYQAVPGDYTGDGITEMGVYRPASGSWYAQQVGAGSAGVIEPQQWAGTDYVGVPGDYDGDGKTDPGVYLEQSGLWMLLMSGSGYQQISGIFGGPGYTALLAGDYDGDFKVDPAVYHRASGLWVLLFSTSQSVGSAIFGGTGFVPVPTDYDGDGITDPAVYATESGYWYILPSTTLTSQGYSLWTRQFGGAAMSATLVPAPGNYDGVGGADLALYDTATRRWYIMTLDGIPLAWDYPMGLLGSVPVLP